MKTLFLILCCTFSIMSLGQGGKLTYYLDKEFGPVSKEQSFYTAIAEPDNGKIKFTAVVKTTNVVVMTGYFTDTTLSVRDGLFTNYSDEGEEIMRGTYVQNVKEGLWLSWDKGKLTDSTVLEKGDAVITVTNSYYPSGKLNTRNYKDNNTKTVEQTWWEEDGSVLFTAHWVKGDGERISFYPDGTTRTVEKYKDSKVVSTRHFKGNGKHKEELKNEEKQPLSEVMASSQPEFPGGMAGFSSYFTKNFRAPQSLFEQVRSIEKITVVFMLDKRGFATDIKVQEFSSFELHEAIREVFNRMPAWNMKGFKSFGPVTYILNLHRG